MDQPLDHTLVIDVGGNNVKIRHSNHDVRRKSKSGNTLTPSMLVDIVKDLTQDWKVERISLGCPAPSVNNFIKLEPVNLGKGWVDFDFQEAFGVPTKVINDAVMQALGSYEGGKMLFLGLGTGLGACMITPKEILPLEIAHLPHSKKLTIEDMVGKRGLERMGQEEWLACVLEITEQLRGALLADYVVLGGGNAKKITQFSDTIRKGSNENAFKGGFRLWQTDPMS